MPSLEQGGQAPDRSGEPSAGDIGRAGGGAQRSHPDLVFNWRRQYRERGRFVPWFRTGSAPASIFFAQPAKHRRIFPEPPRCWGSAKTHDRTIVHSGISAARSKLGMIRLRFGKRKAMPSSRAHGWPPSAAVPVVSPVPREVGNGQTELDDPRHCLSAPQSRQSPGMRIGPDFVAGRPIADRCARSEPDRRELR